MQEFAQLVQLKIEIAKLKKLSFVGTASFLIISLALVAALSSNTQVKGISTTKTNIIDSQPNEVLGAKTNSEDSQETQDQKLVALTKPSVVRILHKYCAKLKLATMQSLLFLSGKSYPFCIGGLGSGFFINSGGYIATNGHVVKFYENESIAAAISQGHLDEFLQDLLYSAYYGSSANEILNIYNTIKSSETERNILIEEILTMYDKKLITVENGKSEIYVALGKEAFSVSSNYFVTTSDSVVSATLINFDYENLIDFKNGFKASDVAIIKVIGSHFPALPLADTSSLKSGEKIIVLGYPGIADNPFLVDTSVVEPTVTKGIISAIKQSSGNKKTLIQTDASINHGNSGGPALNTQGEVIGIATYGTNPEDGSGNFNFLRDIKDIQALMEKAKVKSTQGETYTLWKEGLDYFWENRYGKAVSKFREVLKTYPNHRDAESYIKESNTAIEDGKDIDAANMVKVFVITAIILAIVFLVLGLGSMFYLIKKRSAKKQQSSNNTSNAPLDETFVP